MAGVNQVNWRQIRRNFEFKFNICRATCKANMMKILGKFLNDYC